MTSNMVTVVMPVFQGEKYLSTAIDSVLNQTYTNFRLVIADDGSTDGSRTICEAYVKKDSRITLLRKKHSGIADTLNLACKFGDSKYIALLDQDDIAMPSRLAVQVQMMESNSDYAVLGSSALSIDESGTPFRLLRRPSIAQGLCFASMLSTNLLINSSTIVRRVVLESVGGYRRLKYTGAEDYDLWLRISKSHAIQNLPSVLVYHRTHLAQASFARLPTQVLSAMEAREHVTVAGQLPVEGASMKAPSTLMTNCIEIMDETLRGFLNYAILYMRLGRPSTAAVAVVSGREYAAQLGCEEMLDSILREPTFLSLQGLA